MSTTGSAATPAHALSPEEREQRKAERRAERRATKSRAQAQELAAIEESDKEAAQRHKALLGRPSEYTDEQADSLCAWIAEGRSANSWCRQHGRAMVTVYRWLRERDSFRARYARAHEDRADSLADQLVDLADEQEHGTLESIAAAKLRIDTRKWVAAKLRPQRWGEAPPAAQHAAVTFNIGISRGAIHALEPTVDASPALLGSAPAK